MKKIGIGVISCADIAIREVIPAIKELDCFKLIGVASRSPEKAQKLADKFECCVFESYNNLIESDLIDAVYIPLPTGLHYEWAVKCLNSGKHVLSEKSLTDNLEKSLHLVSLARQNKVVLFENFMFQYHDQINYVQDLLKKGTIGDLRLYRSIFCFPQFKVDENIRYSKSLGGGALLDVGAYTLMGASIFMQNVSVLFSNLCYHQVFDVDFSGSALLKGKDNVQGQIFFGFDHFYQNTIELVGTTGKITLERAYTAGPRVIPQIILEQQGVKEVFTLKADNHFKKILSDFNQAILKLDVERMLPKIEIQARLLNDILKLRLKDY